MIDLEEARNRILDSIRPLEMITVPLFDSLGLVLAEDVYSDMDIPPFHNSAMDGFAIRAADTVGASKENARALEVKEDLPAGYVSSAEVTSGSAIKIMTGAPLPRGADAVIPVEDTSSQEGRVLIFREVREGANVRKAGEDVKKGELVIGTGSRITAAEFGMLASLGRSQMKVRRQPRAGIIATGDELVGIDEEIRPGKIRDSNSFSLIALVRECKGIPMPLGIVRDQRERLKEVIRDNLSKVDLFITSGGVSVGDYDIVKDVLSELGEMSFWKVAMKPGKPLAFGFIEDKPLFGLPGNPVAVAVSFEQFVRPSILKMMGRSELFRPEIEATLVEDIKKKPGRLHLVRVHVFQENGCFYAQSTGPQGSGILKSMVLANGLALIPRETTVVRAGEKVRVQMLKMEEDH
jgi:molybdopterin molybdotransferase